MAGFDLGDIVAHLKVEMGEFTNSLNVAKNEIESTSSKFDGIAKAGGALKSVGATMTASITAPVVALGASAVKTTTQFNAAMSKVQGLSGATGKELEMLRNTAKEMGATTMYSATEAADALGYMALAGWDANESTSALPGVLNLAAASGMELAQASDLVTDYLSAFGESADQAGRMADVLAHAQANSNTTTEQLGDAFKNCAVNANAFGLDIEQTTAVLGKLADQGLKGSEAGTALNAVFRDMSSKMENGAIKIGQTSVAITDASGNFKSMEDIVRGVTKATDGMSESEKMVALQSTFTADSIKAMGILTGAGADEIAKFTEELYGAEGAAKKMADTMNDNLQGDVDEMKSAFEAMQLAIGEKLDPILRAVTQTITKLFTAFSKLPQPVMIFIMVLAGILAVIGPLLLIIGQFMISLKGIRDGFLMLKALKATTFFTNFINPVGLVKTAFLGLKNVIMTTLIPALQSLWAFMLANPITLVIAAIALLVGAFVWLWNNCEGFRNFWIGLWEDVKQVFMNFYNDHKATIDQWVAIFKKAWEGIKMIFSGALTFLKGLLTLDFGMMKEGLVTMWDGIKQYFSAVWDNIKFIFGMAWEGIKSVMSGFGEWCWNFCTTTLPNAWNQFLTWLGSLPGKIAYWLGYALGFVIKWGYDMAMKAWEAGSNFVTWLIQFLKKLPGKVWNWLVNTIQRVIQWRNDMRAKAREAGINFINGVIQFLQQLPGKVWQWLSSTISKARQFVSDMKSKASEAARGFISNITSGLASLPGKLVSIGKNAVQGLINGINSGAGALWDAAQNLASQAWNGMKSALGIHSPSTVMRDKVGQWIPKGVVVGIKANAKEAYRTMDAFARNLSSRVNMPDLMNSMNISTGNVSTANIVQMSDTVVALRRLEKVIENSKTDIDYNRMADAFQLGAQKVDSTIYMDHEVVGKKTAPTVNKASEMVRKRLNRLEGKFDE